jgi:hypothetical protein
MIKTFTVLVSHHYANHDQPVMMLLGKMKTDPQFWILNLGHWDLFVIWLLVLGIFMIFQ